MDEAQRPFIEKCLSGKVCTVIRVFRQHHVSQPLFNTEVRSRMLRRLGVSFDGKHYLLSQNIHSGVHF